MSLRLLRLPSGAWSLVAVPDAQRPGPARRDAQAHREDPAELPAAARLRPTAQEAV